MPKNSGQFPNLLKGKHVRKVFQADLQQIGEEPYAVTTHPFETDRAGTRTDDNYQDRNA